MDEATKQSILSGVRSILIAVGGILAGKGVIDEGQWTIIVGAVMVILPAAWGIYDKIQTERKTQARETVAVNVGIAATDASAQPISPAEAKGLIADLAPIIQPASKGTP